MPECTRCGTHYANGEYSTNCSVCGAFIDTARLNEPPKPEPEKVSTPNDLVNILSTINNVLLSPATFFRTITEKSPAYNAWLFALATGTFGFTGSLIVPGLDRILPDYAATGSSLHQPIGQSLLMAPFMTLIGVLFVAIYSQFMVRITGNRRARFKTTLIAACYAEATSLLLWIPVFGTPIAAVWSLVIWVAAIAEIHRMSHLKTFIVLMVPLFILMILLFIILMSAAMGGLFAGQMLKDSLFPGR